MDELALVHQERTPSSSTLEEEEEEEGRAKLDVELEWPAGRVA